jgi:CRISPR-associated protein Csd1
MILQSLVKLYDRREKLADPASRPAPIGFEEKEIPFVIELDRRGGLIQILDTRSRDGKRLVGRAERVPQGAKKTSGVSANLLWDTAEYVLGCEVEVKGREAKPECVVEQHAAFRQRIDALPDAVKADEAVQAVLQFLDALDHDVLKAQPQWPDIRSSNPLLSFRLQDDLELVCQRAAVREAWLEQSANEVADGVCLVTGEPARIERLHSAIKNVWGAQSSGANVVSFNLDAFESWGRKQGDNAPIGVVAATKYTTALNDLLARGSRQRVQVGDASTVFWAERESRVESDFFLLIGEPQEDDPSRDAERAKAVYEQIRTGRYLNDVSGDDRFHVLGLAPNAARIAVRFWHTGTVASLVATFAHYFEDIAIDHGPNQPDLPSLFRMLSACALQGKADNISPNLGGEIVRAVLSGLPFPATWLQAAVRRCRAERQINYLRAAAIKACLNRRAKNDEEKLTVSLDPNNTHVAYRLGRLFAVLERIQEEASRNLNATIRDRYFGAASSNPLSVFPTLNRLKNHHLAKLESRGRARNLEKLVGEIIDGLPADRPFPANLPLVDQGRFAVGYYHQRQHSSTYKTPTEEAPTATETES